MSGIFFVKTFHIVANDTKSATIFLLKSHLLLTPSLLLFAKSHDCFGCSIVNVLATPLPFFQILIEEQKITVHRALRKLHPEYRQILWPIYYEDFPNADAATVMKMSARQIKNFVYRAKSALKSELDKEGFV